MNYFTLFLQYIISPVAIVTATSWILSKTFNLGKIANKIDGTAEDVKNIKKDILNLHKDSKHVLNHVNIMKAHLVGTSGLDSNLFIPGSPLKLMKKGKELLKKSDFKRVYKENKGWFLKKIKTFNVKTLSDVDEASLLILEEYAENNDPIDFKEIAFDSGISKSVLLRVIAIYLRNELAKELKI